VQYHINVAKFISDQINYILRTIYWQKEYEFDWMHMHSSVSFHSNGKSSLKQVNLMMIQLLLSKNFDLMH